jgi:outer membrane protein TolC
MKTMLLLLFGLYSVAPGYSQTKTNPKDNSSFMLDDSTGKALAELAVQSTSMTRATKLTEASKYEWRATRMDYLNNLRASFNLNELNIKGSSNGENVFYPRYNFSMVLPVGMFFTNGKTTKKTKAIYESNVAQKTMVLEDQKEQIETAYQDYQMQRMLLALQETIVQDESAVYSQLEQKFSANSITIDEFSAGSKRYNVEVAQRITLIRDRNVAKIKLEKLIGMDLEDALKLIAGKNTSGSPSKK